MKGMRQMGIAGAPRRRRVGRSAVFAGSALFHLALFLVVFSRAAGSLVSASDAGGGPQGPVFAVSLVRLQAPTRAEETDTIAESRPLLMKLRHVDAPNGIPLQAAAQTNPLQALAERLTAQSRPAAAPDHPIQARRVQLQGAYVPDDTRLADVRSRGARTEASADGESSNSASTGTLWGAIEPCWSNLGFRGQIPVTIDVALDTRGGLKGPPKVIRNASARLDESRLRSEANALAALAACMPRVGEVRLTGNNVRLEFPGS
jgi:hypothetical protein